jgi:hypothetical protein
MIFIATTQMPIQGPAEDATAGQRVTMHCMCILKTKDSIQPN